MTDRQSTDNEATQLRALWDRLGIPGIVDIHTHFMPDQVMAKVWAYFDRVEPFLGRPWPITYRDAESDRIDTLRRFGVLAFPSLVYPHKAGMAAWLNDWSLGFAARTSGCIPTATFFPEQGCGDYVASAISRGARIFKSHLQVGAYDPNDPLLDPVWTQIQSSAVPVVFHAGSGPAPGLFTGPDGVRDLLGRFPDLRLIIAHMGMPEYREFLDIASTHDGVFLDTTMAFTSFIDIDFPFPDDQLERLVELDDRILFGSDYPNIPYSYLSAVQAVVDLGLGDDWLRQVFYNNPRRIGFPG